MDWDYDEGTLLADSSLKATPRFVDPITFSSWVSVARLPHIEDCDHDETTVFKIVQPRRFCGHKDLKGHATPKYLSLLPSLTVPSLSLPRGKSPARSHGANKSNIIINIVDSDKVQKDIPNDASQKKDLVHRLGGVSSNEVNKGRVVVLRGGNSQKIAGNDHDKDGMIPPSTDESMFRNAGNNGTLETIHDDCRGDKGIPLAFRTNSPFQNPSHQTIDFHNIF